MACSFSADPLPKERTGHVDRFQPGENASYQSSAAKNACPVRFIEVPDGPGLGIESLNDAVIRAHLDPLDPGLWESTAEWDDDRSNDRLWS